MSLAHYIPILFFFLPPTVPILCSNHTHIRPHKLYELPLLPTNTAGERILYKSGAVRIINWIFIVGAPARRWLGEYGTLQWNCTVLGSNSNKMGVNFCFHGKTFHIILFHIEMLVSEDQFWSVNIVSYGWFYSSVFQYFYHRGTLKDIFKILRTPAHGKVYIKGKVFTCAPWFETRSRTCSVVG
jgi:hypothetical protein